MGRNKRSLITGIKFILFLFVLFSFNSIIVHAQTDNSTLRVIVTSEEDGTTIIGSTIFLTNPNADTLHSDVTDSHGFAEFSNISPQEYQVHISYVGMEKLVEPVTLEPGETRILRAELAVSTAALSATVTDRRRTGTVRRDAGMQTIGKVDLARIPSAGPGGDLTSYLQTLSSVTTTGDRGGELYIRGGTPNQNLTLVENMPIIKPFHISNLFSSFPQEAISSVDFYAGGFGAEYTGANSSVLDVKLRQGNLRNHQAQFAASPYLLTYQMEGPIVRDQQSFFIMGRHSVIEQTGPDLTGEEVPINFYDIIARYSFNASTLSCNVTGISTYDRGQINPLRDVDLEWSNTVAGLRCLGYAEELENALDFTIGYTGYKNSETGIDDFGRSSSIDMGYMRLDNDQVFFGLDGKYGFKLDFINYKARLDKIYADRSLGNPRYNSFSSTLDEMRILFSMYSSIEWEPSSKLTIEPGLASQTTMISLSPTLEPRLRVSYHPKGNDDSEISLSMGRYFQIQETITDERDAGTVFGVYKPIGKDDPLPESLHGILGYRQRLNESIEFSIEGYTKFSKNFPVARWTREPSNTLETGLAESFIYGGDIQLELNRSDLYVSLGYGLSEVTYKASADELVAWIEEDIFDYNPAHDRRHQFNLISSYELGKFTANVSWQYTTGGTYTKLSAFEIALTGLPNQNPLANQGTVMTLFSKPFDGRMPDFQRIDVSLKRPVRLSENLNLETEVGLINAFNMKNVFYFDVNTLEQVDQMPLVPYLSITTQLF